MSQHTDQLEDFRTTVERCERRKTPTVVLSLKMARAVLDELVRLSEIEHRLRALKETL